MPSIVVYFELVAGLGCPADPPMTRDASRFDASNTPVRLAAPSSDKLAILQFTPVNRLVG
ncbi:hypothetical protein NS14008_14885 [Nocardia seriolae]|nr:hypothetical protein NS14008_14885 [Nocardia seriolae]